MKTWDETFYNNSSRLNSHKAGKEMRANGRGVEALGFKCLCVCVRVCEGGSKFTTFFTCIFNPIPQI